MKWSHIPAALLVLLSISLTLSAQVSYPSITKVAPDTAKAGAILSIAGENLDKDKVAEIYLTDGKNDIKLEIIEQTATALKVRVPDPVKTGRFSLMILTATTPAQYFQMPVKVTIE
jgi:hypothetical protein